MHFLWKWIITGPPGFFPWYTLDDLNEVAYRHIALSEINKPTNPYR
jgi:hypothetical protein